MCISARKFLMPEKALGIISPGVGVSDGCKPATSNLRLLEDQQVFLTTEPSLQHLNNVFFKVHNFFSIDRRKWFEHGNF